MDNLRDRIQHAINCSSAENGSDTPDFVLADYLTACLKAFDAAVIEREKFYGRHYCGRANVTAVNAAGAAVGE